MHEAEKYMPWEAAIERSYEWQWTSTEGLGISKPLTCADPHSQGEPNSIWEGKGWYHPYSSFKPFRKESDLKKNQWKSWIVLIPETKEYSLTLKIAGEGKVSFSVDERYLIGKDSSTITGKKVLTQGIHAIKVLCTDGTINVDSIIIK